MNVGESSQIQGFIKRSEDRVDFSVLAQTGTMKGKKEKKDRDNHRIVSPYFHFLCYDILVVLFIIHDSPKESIRQTRISISI